MINDILVIDTKQVARLLDIMQNTLGSEWRNKSIYWALRRTAVTVKSEISKEIRKKYNAKARDIKKSITGEKIISKGPDTRLYLDLEAVRGKLGLNYKATPSAAAIARQSTAKKFRSYGRVKARILVEKASRFPPDTFVIRSGKLAGKYMTRVNGNRAVIRPAVGIAIPQMPLNRAAAGIQQKALETLEKRLMHEFEWSLGQIQGKIK